MGFASFYLFLLSFNATKDFGAPIEEEYKRELGLNKIIIHPDEALHRAGFINDASIGYIHSLLQVLYSSPNFRKVMSMSTYNNSRWYGRLIRFVQGQIPYSTTLP